MSQTTTKYNQLQISRGSIDRWAAVVAVTHLGIFAPLSTLVPLVGGGAFLFLKDKYCFQERLEGCPVRLVLMLAGLISSSSLIQLTLLLPAGVVGGWGGNG